MEVILSTSLYQAKEVLIFYVHFFYRRTFYLCGAAEVVFPFFHMKKAPVAKNSEVYADSLEVVYDLSSPVVGVSFDRPFYLLTVLSGVPRHWRYPLASGGHPPGFNSENFFGTA